MNLQSTNRVKVPLRMKWALALALEANFIALPWLGSEYLVSPLSHDLPDGDARLPLVSWL